MQTRTLLLYAQDSRGLGHITRALTIARRILAAYPTSVAYIATKSPVASNFTLPERCDYIKLPTRLTPGTVRQTVDEEEAAIRRFRSIRSRMLREAAQGLAPALVLVDHEPLGSGGEFRDGLYALKAQYPATRFVYGLRDIMDDPGRIRALWQELGVYDAFENLYDGIAVYGWPRLYDVSQAYAIPESVRPKLHYCGYVVRDAPACDAAAVRREHGLAEGGPLVLATVGSGSDGYPVLDAVLPVLGRLRADFPDLVGMVVTGPLMPVAQQAALEARTTTWCRVVPRADTFRLMRASDAILSMGGYNSVCEALSTARPLVIVPRETHKVEQAIRAELLAARGLARCIHPNALNPERLAEALKWALCRDPQAHARRMHEIIPSFDGAARLTAYLSRWLGAD